MTRGKTIMPSSLILAIDVAEGSQNESCAEARDQNQDKLYGA